MSEANNTDALRFNFRRKNTEDKQDSVLTKLVQAKGISRDDDRYDMSHYKRGKALVFNHYEFNDNLIGLRYGTEEDAKNVVETFQELHFDVHRYDDLEYGQIYDVINGVAQEDHADNDCLVVVVMSHGDRGKIHAKDHTYPTDTLWLPFSGNKCPSLAGKPKLFFIQACRGGKLDAGVTVEHDSGSSMAYTLPSMADFLIMYSTTDKHYSFRSREKGAWFIQALCRELRSRARDQDLLTMLTFVNRTIAIEYSSNIPDMEEYHRKKQVGSILSSLTRILYFF